MEEKNKNNEKNESSKIFTKQSFLKSKEYKKYFDIINALCDDDKLYTKKQIDSKISQYLKGRV